jgi:hypothetical protein
MALAPDPRFHGVTNRHLLARIRVAGPSAFAEAGITHKDVDHLMI